MVVTATPKSKRAKRALPPATPERLVATVSSISRSYFISDYRSDDIGVDDEAITSVQGQILSISKRHRKHVGEHVDISLCCARRFDGTEGSGLGKPFLVGANLRKNQRSLMAYLPADAYRNLPELIASHVDFCIAVSFEPIRWGSATLLSLWFGSRAELAEIFSDR